METTDLKALARAVLERNRQGNSEETQDKIQGNFEGKKEAESFPGFHEVSTMEILDDLIRRLSKECPDDNFMDWIKGHDPQWYEHILARAKHFEALRVEAINGRVAIEDFRDAAQALYRANAVGFELFKNYIEKP